MSETSDAATRAPDEVKRMLFSAMFFSLPATVGDERNSQRLSGSSDSASSTCGELQ